MADETQRSATEPEITAELPAELASEALALTGEAEPTTTTLVGAGRVHQAPADLPAFARHMHQYVREYISLADKKAAFIFAVGSGLLIYFYRIKLQGRWLKVVSNWSAVDLLSFVAMLSLFIGVVAAAGVVVPRMRKSHRGTVYFGSVADHESAAEYAASVYREDNTSLASGVLRHTYDLARVCVAKYRLLNAAIWASVVGAVVGLLVLLLAGTAPSPS